MKINLPAPLTLSVIFAVLRLFGVINWSWLWILSPIWLYALGIMLITLGIVILALVEALNDSE